MPDRFGKMTTGEIREIVNARDYEQMAYIPVEDLRIFFDNEQQRDLLSMDGVKNLYAAICERAVDDYKTIHKTTLFRFNKFAPAKKGSIELMLENFLGSEFFLNVSGMMSKEHVIRTIEKTMIEERKRQCQRTMV